MNYQDVFISQNRGDKWPACLIWLQNHGLELVGSLAAVKEMGGYRATDDNGFFLDIERYMEPNWVPVVIKHHERPRYSYVYRFYEPHYDTALLFKLTFGGE